MPFTNLPIKEDELPQVQSVPLKPIHPDYLKALRITWLIIFFIILAGAVTLFILVDELQTMLAVSIGISSYLLLLTSTVMIGTRSFKRKK